MRYLLFSLLLVATAHLLAQTPVALNEAEPFDERGFAKIKKEENGQFFDYLLDTTGRTCRVAYDIKDLSAEITALDLSELGANQLTTLPAEIGDLESLRVLISQGTQLTTLPAEIGKLKNLTTLDLSLNQLSTLPTEIGELKNLTTFEVWLNQLSTLPTEIEKLKNLTTLNLRGNPIPEPAIDDLKKAIPWCEIVF